MAGDAVAGGHQGPGQRGGAGLQAENAGAGAVLGLEADNGLDGFHAGAFDEAGREAVWRDDEGVGVAVLQARGQGGGDAGMAAIGGDAGGEAGNVAPMTVGEEEGGKGGRVGRDAGGVEAVEPGLDDLARRWLRGLQHDGGDSLLVFRCWFSDEQRRRSAGCTANPPEREMR